jgi:hypothetical protein
MKTTRFSNLGYKKEAPNQWSFYDMSTNGSIGAKYKTERELLADCARFAKERGYDAIKNIQL